MLARTFFLLFALSLMAPFAQALASDDMGQIRQRMAERRPAIETLWASDVIGESNKGLLAWGFRGTNRAPSDEEKKLLEAENKDRRAVYQSLAKRHDASVDRVGQHRAAQIAQRAKPGLWLQDAEGAWYRK